MITSTIESTGGQRSCTKFLPRHREVVALLCCLCCLCGLGPTLVTAQTNFSPNTRFEWSPWTRIPSDMLTDAAVSCESFDNHLYVFAKRVRDNRVFFTILDKTNWSPWKEVPGSGVTDASPAAAAFNGNLYLFAKGIDDKALHQNVLAGGKWSGWSSVPGGARTDVAPDAIDYGGYLYLFRKGFGETNVYFNALNLAGWTGWVRSPTNLITDKSVATTRSDKKLFLFSKAHDSHKIHLTMRQGTTWGSTAEVPGNILTDVSLSASAYGRRVFLFAKGARDRRIQVNHFDGATWAGWTPMPGEGSTRVALASCEYRDAIYLFATDPQMRILFTRLRIIAPSPVQVTEITNTFKVTNGFVVKFSPELEPAREAQEVELFSRITNHPVVDSFVLDAGATREFSVQMADNHSLAVSVNSSGSAAPLGVFLVVSGTNFATGTGRSVGADRANVSAIARIPQAAAVGVRIVNPGTKSVTVRPAIESFR